MNGRKALIILSVFFFQINVCVFAQQTLGGIPLGLQESQINTPSALLLPAPDVAQLLKEDEQSPGFRFAAPLLADISPDNAGIWTDLPGGDRVWTLRLTSPGAKGLAVLYDQFYLPPGSRLYMYSEDGKQVLGAYAAHNNSRSGRFLTGFIESETAVIEYYEPAIKRGQGRLHIFRVEYAYRAVSNTWGFGASWPCHNNIGCPSADTLNDISRSVCRIMMVVSGGTGFCSGTLINNTRNNGVPYVISAYHCNDGYTSLYDLWRFDFNYQGSACTNPSTEPLYQSILGCDYRSGRRENDFRLLELFSEIPASYQAYFAGWDRSATVPSRSSFIHHPRGDIKKVSWDVNPALIQNTTIQWDNNVTTPVGHHFRVVPDFGTFQSGSSGCGLFNQDKRFVGQLHGGTSSCDSVTTAYFGRMTLSWTGGGTDLTRLRDWLDPDNTDAMTLDGMDNPAEPAIAVSGTIRTEAGAPIPGVRVWLEGIASDTVTTGVNGVFSFPVLDPGFFYTLRFDKDTLAGNGVSTQDVIQIQRQVLSIEPLNSAYKQYAADVNGSNSVTTMDIINIRRMILSTITSFPVPAWLFFNSDYTFMNPLQPFSEQVPGRIELGVLTANRTVNVTGIKSGDVNGSADPTN